VPALRVALILLSSVLGTSSTVPYIVATVRRNTRPKLVTWGTWSALTAVAGAASASTGDYPSAAFSLVGTAATAAVVVAGVRFGDRQVSRLDLVCLAGVVTGFALWRTLDLPGIAVLAACVIDCVGLVPTLVHGWRRPDEETALTYGAIAAGGVFATLAAWGTWTVTAVAYPIYVAVSMGLCCALILARRRRRPAVAATAPTSDPAVRRTHEPGRPVRRPHQANQDKSRRRNKSRRKRSRRQRNRGNRQQSR
jgi:hypothetical protein